LEKTVPVHNKPGQAGRVQGGITVDVKAAKKCHFPPAAAFCWTVWVKGLGLIENMEYLKNSPGFKASFSKFLCIDRKSQAENYNFKRAIKSYAAKKALRPQKRRDQAREKLLHTWHCCQY
jgi:hypothetical protein